VLVGGHVIDVRTGEVHEGVNVWIKGDRIVAVDREPPRRRHEQIDVTGRWIVPGFFDLHAHVIPVSEVFPAAKPPEETLRVLLDHGVTTIRCLPLLCEMSHGWSARVNAGELLGPTLVTASMIFEKLPQRTSFGFGNAETARRWVQKEALLGTRWIKVYNSMDAESLAAIVAAAREHGLRVCGHAEDVPPREASDLGLGTVEHMISIPLSCLREGAVPPEEQDLLQRAAWRWEHFDEAAGHALMGTFRANGTGWVPTLVVTERMILGRSHDGEAQPDEAVIASLREALAKSAQLAVHQHRQGGLVGIGTDFPVDGVEPGTSVHRELELLVSLGGATPLEALQMATLRSAEILGFGDITGTVEPERLANLVVLRENPLASVANTRSIELVLHDGRLHRPE
jgi:imidazolonepropionase-like amidohydrolase